MRYTKYSVSKCKNFLTFQITCVDDFILHLTMYSLFAVTEKLQIIGPIKISLLNLAVNVKVERLTLAISCVRMIIVSNTNLVLKPLLIPSQDY